MFCNNYHSKVLIKALENHSVTVRYEANPPKILSGIDLEHAVTEFVKKIKSISDNCDSIHLTEDVLGFQRMPPIMIGRMIRDVVPDLPLTVSLRVRDKTERQIQEFVDECISAGFSGILVLMGDPSQNGRPDSGEIPSTVVKRLHSQGIDSKIDLYLSVPNNPDFERLGKKIEANPKGFITQVIQSPEQVQNLHDGLPRFEVIPIILFPSEKNLKSAKFLNIDFATYGKDFAKFASDAHAITGDILITSPNDFHGLKGFLEDKTGAIKNHTADF